MLRLSLIIACLAAVGAAIAQPAGSPWPMERQDRWGTGRAIYGPAAETLTTPWLYRKVSNYSIVSHGASLGPDGIGYVGNWTSDQVLKFDYNTGDVIQAFNALNFVVATPAIGLG